MTFERVQSVAIEFTEVELKELLGSVKVKQMRLGLNGQTIDDYEMQAKQIRKINLLKRIQAKLEQGALTF